MTTTPCSSRRWRWLAVTALVGVGVAGCDSTVIDIVLQPLEVTAKSPLAGATGVEAGATVSVTFNQAIDLATLTAQTFQVRTAEGALPASITYDAATRTGRAAAPLLPNTSYQAEVTTGVRTADGTGLSTAETWSFTTRAWQATTVDATGFTGLATSLAVDETGRVHVSYFDLDNSSLKYATCAPNCMSWSTVTVDRNVFFGSTSIAVDGSGRAHISYEGGVGGPLKYASCSANCSSAGNWTIATADSGARSAIDVSLDVDATGRVHVSYYDTETRGLKYATCPGNCTSSANWNAVIVDAEGDVGQMTAIAVEGSGRVHVSYFDITNQALKYTTCASNCTVGQNWQAVTVDDAGSVGFYTSVTVSSGGRLHIGYYDATNRSLKYATCVTNCFERANWVRATVDVDNVGAFTSLAVDVSGRLHVSYYDGARGNLKYATCPADCTLAGNWRAATVDAEGDVGTHTSIAVDGNGRVHVSYHEKKIEQGALKVVH